LGVKTSGQLEHFKKESLDNVYSRLQSASTGGGVNGMISELQERRKVANEGGGDEGQVT